MTRHVKAEYRGAVHKMSDQCRDVLLKQGWIPLAKAKKIRFLRDTEALVIGGPLTFGAVDEEQFEAGSEHEVESVTPQAAPSSDMADVVFKHGRKAPLLIEDFEVIA